jgi:uncharacterized protein (DUF1778 family)
MDISTMLGDQESQTIEIQATGFAAQYIAEAAALAGQDVGAFMIAAAFVKADSILEKFEQITLSDAAYDKLTQIIDESEKEAKPSPKLIELMKRRRQQKGK